MIYFEGTDFVIHTVYGIDRQLDSLDESSNLTLFDFDFTWIDHIGDDGRSSRMNFYIMLTSVLCFVRWKGLWDDTSYERYVSPVATSLFPKLICSRSEVVSRGLVPVRELVYISTLEPSAPPSPFRHGNNSLHLSP